MKFSGYNLVNQRLDSEWLIKLLRFCSNDYAGAIGENEEDDPLVYDETNDIFILSPCNFSVGGQMVSMTEASADETIEIDSVNSSNTLYGVVLGLDEDKTNTNITTNELAKCRVGYIDGFTITQITDNDGNLTGYFEIKKGNEGWDRYHYDTQKFNSVSVKATASSTSPETINNAYVIPIVGYDSATQKVVRLLGYKTGSALEEFLTKAAIDQLIDILNDRYVWREGGKNESKRGNIGNLNVTDNVIRNPKKDTSLKPNQANFFINNSVTLRGDYIKLQHPQSDNRTRGEDFSPGVLTIKKLKNDNSYSNCVVSTETLPISLGGTSATEWQPARRNFKIVTSAERAYEEGSGNAYKINGKAPTAFHPAEYTIYFSIIDTLPTTHQV